ncbi:MAG: hypothetical protein J3Q66DRAFT_382436 [Benniella sp.]|nr:MAG: hypothetical protein J3Q66DRAFT_382436 [Benniella sp.]
MGEFSPQRSPTRSNGTKRMSFTAVAFLILLLLHITVPVVSAKSSISTGEKLTSYILSDILESPDASKYLLMQSDGNVAVYQAGELELNNNGVLFLRSPDGKIFWTYHCRYSGTSFTSSFAMGRHQCISSPDLNNFLVMQDDSNVVIYKKHAAYMSWSNAMGKGGSWLKMNDMGALQVQSSGGVKMIFNILKGVSTSNKGPYTVRLSNDAKISIKDDKEEWTNFPN